MIISVRRVARILILAFPTISPTLGIDRCDDYGLLLHMLTVAKEYDAAPTGEELDPLPTAHSPATIEFCLRKARNSTSALRGRPPLRPDWTHAAGALAADRAGGVVFLQPPCSSDTSP